MYYKTRRESDGTLVNIGDIIQTLRDEDVIFLGGTRPNEFVQGGGRSGKIVLNFGAWRGEYYDGVCGLIVSTEPLDAPEPVTEQHWTGAVIAGVILLAMIVGLYVRGAAPAVDAANTSPSRIVVTAQAAYEAGRRTALYETLRPCATEDSNNCLWDATTRGNGLGTSFYRQDGHA